MLTILTGCLAIVVGLIWCFVCLTAAGMADRRIDALTEELLPALPGIAAIIGGGALIIWHLN